MSESGSVRRLFASGLVVSGAVTAGLLVAPSAQAATTTHCVKGNAAISPSRIILRECSDFVDNGAPYVFRIDELAVLNIRTTPITPPVRYYRDVTATCSGYAIESDGRVTATDCTI